ncbi:MAG: 7-cyano-7-deazaguanine synthase [Actinomycetota bacterium]|nr:7-cyano-7-deazaguanine synthase [Actinomycetota bacterium]
MQTPDLKSQAPNFKPNKNPKAVALLSGGLDSTLAILVMKRLGVEVTAITFLTHFGCDISDSSSCSRNPFPAAEKFGFKVKLSHLADKFIDIVKKPAHGHGRNMNPCIDCRILMLREAGEYMRMSGADFLITGEVLGQRPMSQRKETFPLIDRESGFAGYVLRPLSAKLLKPTVAETSGLINRDSLYNFSGRSRKPQMKLAEEFGLDDYPNPAGGCLLTEPNYAWRLKELLELTPNPTLLELGLLRLGRHFRPSAQSPVKIIAGRDEGENNELEKLIAPGDTYMMSADQKSPIVLITGTDQPGAALINMAASICARYSRSKNQPAVKIDVFSGGKLAASVQAAPAKDEVIDALRIQKPEKGRKVKP